MKKEKFEYDEESILKCLNSSDSDEQRQGAFDAAEHKLVGAVPVLVKLIQSSNLGVQEAAEFAIKHIRGREAVRAVAPLLRVDNPSVRNSAMDILREICDDDLTTIDILLSDDDADIRIFSADILGSSCSHAAVTLLSDALSDDPEVNVRYQAAVSLGVLGNPVASNVLRKAMHDEEWVQFAVVEALAKIRAESCVDILLQSLPESSELVSSTIIDALGEMKNVKSVPILLQQLDTVSGPLRNKAVKAIVQILGAPSLGLLGQKDLEKFKSYLLAALNDEDEEVFNAVLIGLSAMGSPETTSVVLAHGAKFDPNQAHEQVMEVVKCLVLMGENSSILNALQSSDEAVQFLAVEACCNIKTSNCTKALIDNFWNFNRDLQRIAMDNLAKIADKGQIVFFEDVLSRHDDAHVLKDVILFLGHTIKHVESGKLFLKFLYHPYDDVKEAALEACININSPEINDELALLYEENDPMLRLMSVYAMGFMENRYFEKLAAALEDEIPDIRKVALEGIVRNTENLDVSLDLLLPRLDDENREVRLALVDALERSGSKKCIDILIRVLGDRDHWVCIRAIEALATHRVVTAVPILVQMLEKADLMVVLKIIYALGIIGDNIAFRTLLGFMSHDEPEVQQVAAEAIARIRQEQGEEV